MPVPLSVTRVAFVHRLLVASGSGGRVVVGLDGDGDRIGATQVPSLTVNSKTKSSFAPKFGAVKVGAATPVELSVTVVPLV